MILNTFLEEMAKAFKSESYVIPAYFGASTSNVTVAATDTSLSGERGTRYATTNVRSTNTVTCTGTRSGTQILVPAGEGLTTFAVFSASTGGTMLSEISVGTLLQTTNFDIESIYSITFNRL